MLLKLAGIVLNLINTRPMRTLYDFRSLPSVKMEVHDIQQMTLNIFFFSRSLDRPRRTLAASGAMASDSSAACSDSETSNLGNRASVPSLDKKDLQRAVAHLQETLQQRMTMQPHTHSGLGSNSGHPLANTSDQQVKAVVHRGPESRTLDGQSIKQYESIKRNQVPYGNWELGPYDTIKPSR